MASRTLSRSSGNSSSTWLWLGIAFAVVLIDQVSKVLVVRDFQLGESRPVTSFFDLVRLENTGMAWSLLANAGGWQRWFFIGLALAASAFMVYLLRRNAAQKLFSFAIAMIMGGAIGNVIDRMARGAGRGGGQREPQGGGAREQGEGRAIHLHHPCRTRRSSSTIRQIAPSVIALSARLNAGKV